MALSKKERYRLNLDALYGTDMSQYRLIDEIHHKKRRKIRQQAKRRKNLR